MSELTDKGLLLAMGLALSLGGTVSMQSVAAFLLAAGAAAVCSPGGKRIAALAEAAVFLCAAAFLYLPGHAENPLAYYLPAVYYACRAAGLYPGCLLLLLLALPSITSGHPAEPLAILALFGISEALCRRTMQLAHVRKNYYTWQDFNREKELRLEEKNRALLEKQDYEIRLATLRERNRIAREIHDNVGHLLTRAILQAGALKILCRSGQTPAKELSMLEDTLNGAMNSVRSSVHDLHEEALDVKTELEKLIAGYSFCPVELHYDAGELSRELKCSVLAIVREALSNTAKHSNAARAEVSFVEHPGFYQLVVFDNGTRQAERDAEGIGLSNMRERAEALGGIFRAESGRGFRIFISIPKGKGESRA